MKAKVLFWENDDKKYYNGIERLYFEPDFAQADRDLDLLNEHAADKKIFKLIDVDVYNADKYTSLPIENKDVKVLVNPKVKINNNTTIYDIFYKKGKGDYYTVRILNCLGNANIKTIGELVSNSEYQLLKLRNMSTITVNEIKKTLAKYNLKLGKDA